MAQDELLLRNILEIGAEQAGTGIKVHEQLSCLRNGGRRVGGKGGGDAADVAPQDFAEVPGTEPDGGVHALDGLDEIATQGFAIVKDDGAFGGTQVAGVAFFAGGRDAAGLRPGHALVAAIGEPQRDVAADFVFDDLAEIRDVVARGHGALETGAGQGGRIGERGCRRRGCGSRGCGRLDR